MNAVIVASGPSAEGFVPPDDVIVIAVNGAIDWLPRADAWFTLDPSMANMVRMHGRPKPGVAYAAAVPESVPLPDHVQRLRRIASNAPVPVDPQTPEEWFDRWSCVPGLSEERGAIHTGNSAYGALGWAYHMGVRRAALVGVDATDEPRIEGGRPNNLSHLPLLFASALGQIDVVSCGRMGGIPQMTVEEGMAWLME